MRFAFYAKTTLAALAAILIGRWTNQQGIQALETSLAGAIGAIVGGVIAALAFAFVVLAEFMKNTSKDDKEVPFRYQAVTQSLFSDIKLLVWCLAAAIFLPVFRQTDIPWISPPQNLAAYLSKAQLITSLEIFIAIASMSVLFEVCHCMFQVVITNSQPATTQKEKPLI